MSDHSRVDRQFLDNLKARVSLLDLVATRVVLKQKGTKWWGCCPFHEENTPSFAVFGSFDNYYCFGCKAYGDVFAFVQYCESCSFMDAVRRLAATAGIAMPLPIEENRRSLDLLDALASWWHTLLLADPQGRLARSYLRSRSVDGETLRDYGVGYAPPSGNLDPTLGWLRTHGWTSEEGVAAGVLLGDGKGGRPVWPLFSGRLVFPIRRDDGRVVAFGGRALHGQSTKYVNSPETPCYHKSEQLYGWTQAVAWVRKTRKVFIVEGYFDVLALHQIGNHRVVGLCGTALTVAQCDRLARTAQEVVVVMDGDNSGQTAVSAQLVRLAQAWSRCGLRNYDGLQVLSLPKGHDPASLIADNPVAWMQLEEQPEAAFTHLLRLGLNHRSSVGAIDRHAAIDSLATWIKAVGDPIVRKLEIATLAGSLELTAQETLLMLERGARPEESVPAQPTTPRTQWPPGLSTSLLSLIAQYPEFINLPLMPQESDWDDPIYRQFIHALTLAAKLGNSPSVVMDPEIGVLWRQFTDQVSEKDPHDIALSHALDHIKALQARLCQHHIGLLYTLLQHMMDGDPDRDRVLTDIQYYVQQRVLAENLTHPKPVWDVVGCPRA